MRAKYVDTKLWGKIGRSSEETQAASTFRAQTESVVIAKDAIAELTTTQQEWLSRSFALPQDGAFDGFPTPRIAFSEPC